MINKEVNVLDAIEGVKSNMTFMVGGLAYAVFQKMQLKPYQSLVLMV